MITGAFCIGAVLFDFDGTLTRPGALDFGVIRRSLGCPPDRPVLEYIQTLPTEAERCRAHEVLDAREMQAAAESRPAPGAGALVRWLAGRRVPCGILTRNSRRAVDRALANFDDLGAEDFAVIITRDTPVAPKPSGAGVRLAAERLGIAVEQVLVVGDFLFDIEAGRQAGSLTAHVGGGRSVPACDFAVSDLAALQDVIRLGLPLAPGKLPNDLLERFLAHFQVDDPSVIVRPGIGQDTAAVDIAGADTLVLTSDPITFATDRIGHYAVLVNANDMATSGALPRWLLASLLFPGGTTPSDVWQVMNDLTRVCRRYGIFLCGGHTEITDAVRRPVINGTMVGTVPRAALVNKSAMAPGDRVLLTKAVAVEGTAIIAREWGAELERRGVEKEVLSRSRRLIEAIGVLEEARICHDLPGVTALHDVTEGGLATAVRELAAAGGGGLHLYLDRVPVFDETRRICELMALDPLGLIGSGSLLICCRPDSADVLSQRLEAAGIRVTTIGVVTAAGTGIQAEAGGRPADWPAFEVDEIARLSAAGRG